MKACRQPGGARRQTPRHGPGGRSSGRNIAVAAVTVALAASVPPALAQAPAPQAGPGLSADAVAQGGLTRLRQGRNAEAAEALAQAIAADPSAGRSWVAAHATAAFATDLAAARVALSAGDADRAEAVLLRAARRDAPERAEAETLLGDLALRRGDAAGAEGRYRAALASRPGLTPALVGLNAALRGQGRFPEAEAMAGRNGAALAGNPRADALRVEAGRTQDPEAALGLLRSALATAPADAGLRLDVARALARLDRAGEGRALLEEGVAGPAGADALYAAALFAREDHRVGDAVRFLSRIPDRLRDAEGVRLLARLRLESEVTAAAEPAFRGAREDARRAVLPIASRPDPSGVAPVTAIRALLAAGDRDGALAAARIAAALPRGSAGRLALAGAMLDGGMTGEAEAVLATLAGDPRLSPAETRQVALLRNAPTIPAVARAPEPGPVVQAESSAFAGPDLRSPAEMLRIAEAVLRRDPRNALARYAAIEAAMALDDLPRAEALLQAGQAGAPNDPRLTVLDARVARRTGDTRRAQAALNVAAEQRRAQIGAERSGGGVTYAAATTRAAEPTSRRVPLAGDGQGSSFTAVGSNPASVASGAPLSTEASVNDPLLNEIGRQLAEVNEEAAGRLTVNGTIRGRSGTRGFERLFEYGGGAEGSVPLPGVGGTITGRVQGVYLDTQRANVNDDFNLRRYGTNAIGFNSSTLTSAQRESLRPRDTTAAGAALGLAYQRDWLLADIGSTPLGFREGNILGGVEITPSIAENWRLRIRGERRAVTDSLLSWGGSRDPRTGETWGGVTRTGGYGQIEYGTQTFGAYAGGGYSVLQGRNVEDNSRYELAAGVSQAIFRRPTEELVTGLDLLYLSYDKNLRLFSFGQGGYFSPQQYFAAAIPLDYRARNGNLAYRIGGSIGVNSFREDRSNYFPTRPDLQAQLETANGGAIAGQTFYQSQRRTSIAGSVRADIEYAITPSIRIGALARYDRTADFNEGRGMIYARFRLD